jgi:hypothetical protein
MLEKLPINVAKFLSQIKYVITHRRTERERKKKCKSSFYFKVVLNDFLMSLLMSSGMRKMGKILIIGQTWIQNIPPDVFERGQIP